MGRYAEKTSPLFFDRSFSLIFANLSARTASGTTNPAKRYFWRHIHFIPSRAFAVIRGPQKLVESCRSAVNQRRLAVPNQLRALEDPCGSVSSVVEKKGGGTHGERPRADSLH